MSERIPPEDTLEHFDYLLNALVEETLLHVSVGDNAESITFHMGMLKAAYRRALERQSSSIIPSNGRDDETGLV